MFLKNLCKFNKILQNKQFNKLFYQKSQRWVNRPHEFRQFDYLKNTRRLQIIEILMLLPGIGIIIYYILSKNQQKYFENDPNIPVNFINLLDETQVYK